MIAYVELQAHRVGIQPTLTIEQVNDYLSRMSSAPDAKEMKEIYMQMITYVAALHVAFRSGLTPTAAQLLAGRCRTYGMRCMVTHLVLLGVLMCILYPSPCTLQHYLILMNFLATSCKHVRLSMQESNGSGNQVDHAHHTQGIAHRYAVFARCLGKQSQGSR